MVKRSRLRDEILIPLYDAIESRDMSNVRMVADRLDRLAGPLTKSQRKNTKKEEAYSPDIGRRLVEQKQVGQT